MVATENERRAYKRYRVSGVHGNMLFVSEVNVINLSLGGAAIEADRRINIGREYTLRLEDSGRNISAKGLVVWSVISRSKRMESGETVLVYQAGIQFKNMLNEKSMEMLHFLDTNKAENEKRLSGVRFLIGSPRTAVVACPQTYEVRNISQSGMLIETDQEFRPEDVMSMDLLLKGCAPISMKGRVASCEQEDKEGRKSFSVGIAFLEISEEGTAGIGEYLKTL